MRELNVALTVEANPGGLDSALRAALASKIIGISTYGPDRPISIWLDDSATPADDLTAAGIADTHDPVFLSTDTTSIPADGSTAAMITIHAPKAGAAPVTLLVVGTPIPVTLIDGIGTLAITSADPASIGISVQNPANRSTDSITVEAH